MDNNNLSETGNFIHSYILQDLGEHTERIVTRFPPEPNGYLHIGHAKSILLNYGMAKMYGGKFNLRFDDTNPAKESDEFVESIENDVRWLGCDWEDRLFFASDYFDRMYECALVLIKKGLAFVCDLTAEEVRQYRGTLSEPGKNSPYRDRSIEENLDLFIRMKDGEFPDGSRTLRAKVDMASPNINMRDPVIYRIARLHHHNTGDKWCIYPMYDYAHPLEDAFEGVTHSLCTMEFEDHRPIYNWFIDNLDFEVKPRQIEFAKLIVSDCVMGKRYNKALVEEGKVDGWDDPRLITLSGMRRRGYTPEAVRKFCSLVGVSKSQSKVDFAMLEYCQREDLKEKAKVVMAVLDPIKLIITNYPEGQVEYVSVPNNKENPDAGERSIPFSRELYIERSDFMEDAPSKFFRLTVGREVRLFGAYFVTCTGFKKDEVGNVTEVYCTYDPETKSGSGFNARKVKGTIHWVSCEHAVRFTSMLYENLVFDDETSEIGLRYNDNSLHQVDNCYGEPCLAEATLEERFQFMRTAYFCLDSKEQQEGKLVFNRIVSMRSSFKL